MSSSIEIAAAAVKAPGKVWVRSAVAVAEILELDINDWDDAWITVQAETDDIFIRFGTTAATATPDPTTVSAAGPPATPATNGCLHVPAGSTREYYLRDFVKLSGEGIFLGHISTAVTTGKIRFYKSSGPRDL
tara:strand:+ start:548 stop:946 length:399 start_codon:yes stop_codon:yes gene_type:complete